MDKFLESILKDDIEGICRICVEAEDERKDDIGNIIDAICPLLQSSQSDLRRVYKALQKELDMNVNERGQRAAKLLGVTPEFIGVKNLGEEVKQKPTNADLIRSMGDDALANAIFFQYKRALNSDPTHLWCNGKGGCMDKDGCELDCDDTKLWTCILNWLRKEAISECQTRK